MSYTSKADAFYCSEDESINMLIKFVKTMAQDNVYIGCMLGTLRTDNALMLNHFFNPQASNTSNCITWRNRELLDKLEILYNNLSSMNKEELGWTKEFEAAFIPKLEEAKILTRPVPVPISRTLSSPPTIRLSISICSGKSLKIILISGRKTRRISMHF